MSIRCLQLESQIGSRKLAAAHRLPTMYASTGVTVQAEAGALMSYGPDIAHMSYLARC